MQELVDLYYIKLAMMALFICGDLFINSTAEYEALNTGTSYDQMSQLQIILLGSSILLQASIFSAFFLMLVDTFPFQVGLVGVVGKKFRYMLIAQVSYSLMTIIVGAMRLVSHFMSFVFALLHHIT